MFYLHVCLCTTCVPKESIRYPGTGVRDGCGPPCGHWEANPGPLEEQPVPLTTEPSLQPLSFTSKDCGEDAISPRILKYTEQLLACYLFSNC